MNPVSLPRVKNLNVFSKSAQFQSPPPPAQPGVVVCVLGAQLHLHGRSLLLLQDARPFFLLLLFPHPRKCGLLLLVLQG